MNETATAEAGNRSRTAELREPLQRGAEQAIAKGKVIQDAAVEALNGSTAALKDQGSQLVEAAKDVAAEAGAKIEAEATRRKNAGADFVETFADSMDRAAGEFEAATPLAATYIRKAAEQVKDVSATIREGDLNSLIAGASDFARRQPTAFLALSALLGFGAVRFLKSAPNRSFAEAAPSAGAGRGEMAR